MAANGLLCLAPPDLFSCATASLRMQVEFGDFDPVETQQKLKPVLKDFIPNEVKNSQPPKEWVEDLCTTHSRMVGFPQQACKENYIRMTMGFDNFGFTTFKLRQCADPDKPHVNEKVCVARAQLHGSL